tara:strand:- start:47 stop:553 length:507 start_codon:yes stop_codon:yes gene_type:complete
MKYAPKKRTLSLSSKAWRQLRAQVLAEEPLCRMCAARGLVVPAIDVDHIEDAREDYTDDNSRENLQSLCHECHSLKTARDMGKGVYLGCDVNGLPLDPTHPWGGGGSRSLEENKKNNVQSNVRSIDKNNANESIQSNVCALDKNNANEREKSPATATTSTAPEVLFIC